jgi:hypothetical protein
MRSGREVKGKWKGSYKEGKGKKKSDGFLA